MSKQGKREPSFSLHEFRSWLAKQTQPKADRSKKHSESCDECVGKRVEARLGIERLKQKIAEGNQVDNAEALAVEFKEEGGTIVAVKDLLVEVQVESGKFFIPQIYTRMEDK